MGITVASLADWPGRQGVDRPLLIAGPCSAESRVQVLETARRLDGASVDYFRAGIWKARTRPGSFEGVGDAALPWLQEVSGLYGFKTATEVASAAHVEAAMAHGIDLLWIGARTTVSPFAVQEIAEALRGTDVPVLVKNPISPEIGLWFGALERIHGAGVRLLGAIHRGFTTSGTGAYRNAPKWEIAIEFRRALPEVPLLLDPSHIAGRRDLVADLAQAGMDLGLDGLMIETHPDPASAWSDDAQQVTPEALAGIMAALMVRQRVPGDEEHERSLRALRGRIDQVDHELLEVLAQRQRIVEEIAALKLASNVTSLQVARWQALLDVRLAEASRLGLPLEHARGVFELIHAEAVRLQLELMRDSGAPT